MNMQAGNNRLNDRSRLELLIRESFKYLLECMDGDVPLMGDFKAQIILFDIPGTGCRAAIAIRHFTADPPEERNVVLSVAQKDSDREYTIYEKSGTNEELRAYLSAEERERMMIEDILHLLEIVK